MCVAGRSLDPGVHGPLFRGLRFVLQGSDSGPWNSGESWRWPSLLLRCGPGGEQPEPSQVLPVLRGKEHYKYCCRIFCTRPSTNHNMFRCGQYVVPVEVSVVFTFILSDFFFLLLDRPPALSPRLHQTLQAVRRVRQGLRPPLPLPQPLRRPRQPPSLPALHPLHGGGAPPVCGHGSRLPAGQDAGGRPQPVRVADAARGGVLGGGADEHERADASVGGVASERAVRGRRHGDHHLLQAVRRLVTPQVAGSALGRRAEVPAGRSATDRPQGHEGGQKCHRHLIRRLLTVPSSVHLWGVHSRFTESLSCTQLCENVPFRCVLCHELCRVNVTVVLWYSILICLQL